MIVDRIRLCCKQQGETISGLEKKLGFGKSTIGKWDTALPTADRLMRVAKYLDVSIYYLLGETDNPHAHKQFSELRLSTQRLMAISEKMNLSAEAVDYMCKTAQVFDLIDKNAELFIDKLPEQ